MRRRTLYGPNKIESKPIDEANYADVCFVDNSSLDKIIVSADKMDDNFPIEYFTPIGIVAVPSYHTDNNKPRLVSLVYMSCDTPESGTIYNEMMYWGKTETDTDGLLMKSQFPSIGTSPSDVTINGTVYFDGVYDCLIPSDSRGRNGLIEFKVDNPSNIIESFSTTIFGEFMCSPYRQDGTKDERYFQEPTNGYSALADFDGKSNTDKILAVDNSSSTSWQTATTINNVSYSDSIHPAAQCCWRFHTVGTSQGDWYLPSLGELGYVLARMQAIQDIKVELLNKGYNVGLFVAKEYSDDSFCSSTEVSDYYCACCDLNDGVIGRSHKDSKFYVNAFLQL